MKTLISSWLIAVALIVDTSAQADEVPVALTYFENTSKEAKYEALSRGLAQMLTTDLAVSKELRIVERDRLNEVLKEIKLQKSPYFDKNSAAKLGKGLGAAYIITGSFLVQDKTVRIDVKVIDVETAAIAFASKIEGSSADIFGLERKLAEQLLKGIGASLSLIAKKQIGSKGTKSFEALMHYSDSLVAQDSNDAVGEKEALQKALKADPEFKSALDRLGSLEGRVATLEKSGGLIIKPESATDYLRNHTTLRAAGKQEEARAALKSALQLKPDSLDGWQAALLTPAEFRNALITQSKLDDWKKKVVRAFLDESFTTLRALGGDSKISQEHRIFQKALMFMLLKGDNPIKTATRAREYGETVEVLLNRESQGMLINLATAPETMIREAKEAKSKYFSSQNAEDLRMGGYVEIWNRSNWNVIQDAWHLVVRLPEAIHSNLKVTISKDLDHPHWKEKAPPKGSFHLSYASEEKTRNISKRDLESDTTFIAGFSQEHDFSGDHPVRVVKYGTPIEVPGDAVSCDAKPGWVMGTICETRLLIQKVNFVPGLYKIRVEYVDSANEKAEASFNGIWAMEFHLAEARSLSGDPYVSPHRIVQPIPSDIGPEFMARIKATRSAESGKPVNVLSVCNYYLSTGKYESKSFPIENIAFDLDFKLNPGMKQGGRTPAEWLDYRAAILKSGTKLKSDSEGCQFLPLPKLSAGPHFVCLVAERINGSLSAEPECLHFKSDSK